MGIEVWALLALVAVLAVYLLPVLIGRRELLGHARAGDRYSGQLRILATPESLLETESCTQGGHAELFRRPPEVRAMKRPVVRNVRALRTERELIHARQAHAHARAARQKAASHRLVVACALLGAVLGTGVVAAATPFPWWPVLVPTALLALSMGAGRHAALASAQAEQRERARIAELEAEVIRLTGHRLPETRHTEVPEAGLRETALETAQEAGLRETGLPEARATETVARAAGADERVETQAQTVERAETAPMAKVVAVGSTAASESSTTVTATPPQGWEPVSVPAPTYTLVGTARRRRLDSVEQVTGGDGEQKIPVPVRPTAARPVAPIAVVTPHAPIDLDEVLERRRASGE